MNRAQQLLRLKLAVFAVLALGAAAWQVLDMGAAAFQEMAFGEADWQVTCLYCSCQQALQLLNSSSGGVSHMGLCCWGGAGEGQHEWDWSQKAFPAPVMGFGNPKMQTSCMPQISAVMLQGPMQLPGR